MPLIKPGNYKCLTGNRGLPKKKTIYHNPWKGSCPLQVNLIIPCHFRMLCVLIRKDPQCLLHDFMMTL